MFDDKIFGNPVKHESAFVSSKTTVIGRVIIDENAYISPAVCLRADEGSPFRISKGTNVQDGVIFHGLLDEFVEVKGEKYSIYIGSHCSLSHGALIHGPTEIQKKTFVGFRVIIHCSSIGRNCFIDFNAVIKNSVIGNNCHIGIGAIVTGVEIEDDRYIPDGVVVNEKTMAKTLARIPKEYAEKDKAFNRYVVDYNKKLVELYKQRREAKKNGN